MTGSLRSISAVVGIGLIVALLPAAVPATAAPGGAPVALVVGLGSDDATTATAGRLAGRLGIDAQDAEPVAGLPAVTIDVPAAAVAAVAATLRRDPAVRYVVEDQRARATVVTSNDPYRDEQWGLDRATVPGAWQRTTGSAGITVAVIDSGVTATADLGGAVLAGYDFVNGDSNPADDNGHGTQVAGIIADRGNNGVRMAGVCWACRILPVKVLNAEGEGSHSDIAAGIAYAVAHGARVVNLSLGGNEDSPMLREAVADAVAHDVLVVAAAGNEGTSAVQYPAGTTGVLSVGASTVDDIRYEWSSYGAAWVDVAAPGCAPATGLNGLVATFCGTSAATPFVAGVAALAFGAGAGAAPRPSANAVRVAIHAAADPIGGTWVGHGRLDALGTIQAVTAPTLVVRTPVYGAHVRGTVAVSVLTTAALGVDRVDLRVGGVLIGTDGVAPFAPSWNTAGVDGPVNLVLRSYDSSGLSTVGNRAVLVDNVPPAAGWNSAPSNRARATGTLRFNVRATDNRVISRVDLVLNDVVVSRDYAAPYVLPLNTAGRAATMRVQARAFDRAGNWRASTMITYHR